MTATRLGVLGGSFNPVHFGHLHIAQRCRQMFELSKIIFVVASVPPHKPHQDLIPLAHRYAMVSLATSGCPVFVPSLAELEPPASSYSIDTLRKLERQYGVCGKDIYFIAGGDSLLEVVGWHGAEDLLLSYSFIFVTRPGFTAPDLSRILPRPVLARVTDLRTMVPERMRQRVADAAAGPECRVFLIEADAPNIAASKIRSLAATGATVDHLVPASVNEYILKLHLYGER